MTMFRKTFRRRHKLDETTPENVFPNRIDGVIVYIL